MAPSQDPARTLVSFLAPTGPLTLGNYLGALTQMTADQTDATCFYGVADLHALTVPHDPRRVAELTKESARLLLAAGLDTRACTLFVQSHVSAHCELAYLLECTASIGEMNRMTQYKQKGRGRPDTRVSLFTYPALMAADILLYQATAVPVGDDQRQHVELTRDLAIRFNRRYGEVFTAPELVTPRTGARVMDLQSPTVKMSKSSASDAGIICLLDGADIVRRKVMRAVTDSGRGVEYDPVSMPGVANLVTILAACSDDDPPRVAAAYSSYAALKSAAADAVIARLEPLQQRFGEVDDGLVDETLRRGAQQASAAATSTLQAARAAIGLR